MRWVTGVHDITVAQYSKGIGVYRSMRSERFTVGGRKWCLWFYPDGSNFEVRGRDASVYLETLCRADTVAIAEFSIALLNRSGDAVHKLLESPALGALHGDSLTLRCIVDVIMERKNRAAGIVAVPVPPSCHAANAEKFLLSGDIPFDLEFHVSDVTFKAHRMVVAGQSPYF
ncbi:hypothetical protein GUJ93_ZPchr0009g2314 [Zizania palustris]|uniref:BTB domain-containing protein n=1 Tax=Zizania palustris TaxID=103762 RepID=A0A8J5V666_ZIZPA|nr:hypothetical protein GUJ93_ZPchr0009g2314 [Zizania palustris]